MRTAGDSRSGLKRNEEQRSNHSEGEQRGLDGVREVHVTNIDSMVTSTDPPQRTYSQRFGSPALKHLHASLRDKVEILAKNPSRFYIYPNAWTFRGPTRLEVLSQFLTKAEAAKDFELCARILEVEKVLLAQILAS